MDGGRRQGRPEEELFLKQPTTATPDTPTVGPLRINKQSSASPPPREGSTSSEHPEWRPPPQPTYSAPISKPPTAPLPYPDDRPRPQPTGGRVYTPLSEAERTSRNTTPDNG